MNDPKVIHNIVTSTVLADAMRHIRYEFMVSVRGRLKSKESDSELIHQAEKAARRAMERVLLEEHGKPGREAVAMANDFLIAAIEKSIPHQGLQLTLEKCTLDHVVKHTLYQEHIKRIYRSKDYRLPIAEFTEYIDENARVKKATSYAEEIDGLSMDEMTQILLSLDSGNFKVETFKD